MQPKVTIISGYFNRESYVKESLDSLISQTYSNLEIIVFDDSSTDNTYKRLLEYQHQDSRIKVIRNETNKGFVNTLIEIFTGIQSEYIAIHGSGDISAPDRIQKQVEFLMSFPDYGLIGTGYKKQDGKAHPLTFKTITTSDLIKRNHLAHGSVMFKLDTYRKAGGYRSFFNHVQDRDLWLRMSLITKIGVLPEVLYKITTIEKSDTVSRNIAKVVQQILLSKFACEQIQIRKKFGYDLLDKYGDKAGLFFDARKINISILKMLMIQFYQGKTNNYLFLITTLKNINRNVLSEILIRFVEQLYSNPLTRKSIVKILKMYFKERKFSNYKELI